MFYRKAKWTPLEVVRWGIIIAATLALIVVPRAAGQTTQATIVGSCFDPSGAVIPNASVRATNVGTNQHFEAKSDAQGNYVIPLLPVGEYKISVSAPGFKTTVRSGITLQVGEHALVNVTLQLGSTTQQVSVSGAAPLVQTASASLGDVIANQMISDLPLNSRNVLTLETLVPGVRSLQGGINVGYGRSQNYQLANIGINGSESGYTAFLMDGAADTAPGWGEVSIAPLVGSIQEFKVYTNFVPPEYGFSAGGVITTVTKSGTNSFHGSLYEFLRNDKLDARNTFVASRPPYRFNQFGVAAGGPVLIPGVYNGRDHTFFFFNYEGSRRRGVGNPITTVPTPAERIGDFSQLRDASGAPITIYDPSTTVPNPNGPGYVRTPFSGNIIPPNEFDPIALNVLKYVPPPNKAPNNPYAQTQNFISSQPLATNTNQFMARVDHSFGSRNRLFGRWSYNREDSNRPDDTAPWPTPIFYARFDKIGNQQALISDTEAFSPTLLNEAHISVMRQHFPFTQGSYGQGWPQKLGFSAIVPPTLFPLFSIGGLATFGGTNTTGVRDETSFQIFDMITKVHENHTFDFGVDLRRHQYANFQVSAPSGSFSFPASLTGNPQSPSGTGSGFATFLLGDVGSGSLQIVNFPTYVNHSFSFFAGDDWKVARRFTLNLGVRYDYQSPPVERRCESSNFNPDVANPNNPNLRGSFQFACKNYGKTVVQSNWTNFSPRVGFAYSLTNDARTVLRGGYGIIYAPIMTVDDFPSAAGFSVTSVYLPPGNNTNFPAFLLENGPPFVDQPFGASLGPNAFLGSSVTVLESKRKTPYTKQWNFGIQHEFPANWLLEVAYAGGAGVHLPSSAYQLNALDPKYYSLGLQLQNQVPNPLAGQVPGPLGDPTVALSQTVLPYPQYSSVGVQDPYAGSSIYHALEVRVEHRYSQGLTIIGSYTFAKLFSGQLTSPISWMSSLASTLGGGYQNPYDRRAERSLDPTDIHQRFVASYVYGFPVGRGRKFALNNRFAYALLAGWSTSGIFTAQGGNPLRITGANNFLATRPNSTGQSATVANPNRNDWFNTSAFINPPDFQFGNLSRTINTRGPGLVDFDMSLLKNFRLTEKVTMQFRADSFNLPNLTNLGLPNTTFVPGPDGKNKSATFGTVTTAYDARSLQFGLKILW